MVQKIKERWRPGRAARQISPGTSAAVELIGAPDDRGVLNVGGRLGAGHGPPAIRQLLGTFMTGIDDAIGGKVELYQGGDIEVGAEIQDGHRSLRSAVSACIGAGAIPVALGGGHDYGHPHFAGAADALDGRVALINVDAHLDVRPAPADAITSGSPFYLSLEEGVLRGADFVEFGIQEHCNSPRFRDYVVGKGARIMMLDECRAGAGVADNFARLLDGFARKKRKVVVSFDIDSVQMSASPGVSAPQADGFTAGEWLAMARLCGESPHVASIGIFETAPSLDIGQATVRLAATTVHRFVSGVSRRGETRSTKRLLKKSRVGRLLLSR